MENNSLFQIGDIVFYGKISMNILQKKFIQKINSWMYEIENPTNKNKMFVKETEIHVQQ
jgi:hypothetical protein